jgi:leucyl aminopeptidase
MREVTLITTANSQIITKQFKALFGNYSLMDQELKDQINDELVEVKIKDILKNNKIEGEKTFS